MAAQGRRDNSAEYARFYELQQLQRFKQSLATGGIPAGGTEGQVIGSSGGVATWVKGESPVKDYFFS